jgi:hypothetical protein
MASQSNKHAVAAFGYALAAANLINAALVVVKEKNAALLGAMNAAASHHWITHGIVIMAAYVVLALVLGRLLARGAAGKAAPPFESVTAAIAGSTLLSGLVIAVFFLFGQ